MTFDEIHHTPVSSLRETSSPLQWREDLPLDLGWIGLQTLQSIKLWRMATPHGATQGHTL